MDLLEDKPLVNNRNEIRMATDLLERTKCILYFFSASWCSLCHDILPILIRIYEEAKRRDYGLEIINVPCENNRNEMMEFLKKQGNWYSFIVGDVVPEQLKWTYTIMTIPSIVVITIDGKIITVNGYKEIMECGLSVLIKWF